MSQVVKFSKLIPTAIVLVIGLVWGGLALLRANHEKAYPMSPLEFMKQSEMVKPGMTAAEVEQLPILHGEVRHMNNRINFQMSPRKGTSADWMIPVPVTYFINVYLDDNGIVESVTTSDG